MHVRLVLVLGLAACSKDAAPRTTTTTIGNQPEPLRPAVELRFGDCAEPGTVFLSGLQPMPLQLKTVELEAALARRGEGVWALPRVQSGSPGDRPYTLGTTRSPFGGSMRSDHGQPTQANTVQLGDATVEGQLDKAIIRRYLKRNLNRLQHCYDTARQRSNKLEGTITAKLTIGGDGKVVKPSASGVDAGLASCFVDVLEKIELPLPVDKKPVKVVQTFRIGKGKNASDDSGGMGTAMHPDEGKMQRKEPSPVVDVPSDYRAGASTPLRALEGDLTQCLRLQRATYGVAVFDIASGTLAAHGVDDAAFTGCVAKLGPKVTAAKPMRCSLAFGKASLHAMPGIDISKTTIVFLSASVAPQDIVPNGQLRGRNRESTTQPVQLDGPLIVRPEADAPMKLVNPVLDGLLESREDYLVAAHRDDGWRLLPEPTTQGLIDAIWLPVEPVPRGTGVRWSSRGLSAWSEGEPSVALSVLLASDSVWIGTTHGDIRNVKHVSGLDAAGLEAVLRELKASAVFTDRNDLEIAAEDDVTFGPLVQVIDLATKTGFSRTMLHTPATISVRFKQ